jgi:hypothetical protein
MDTVTYDGTLIKFRYDSTTKKGSVIDVLRSVHNVKSNHAAALLKLYLTKTGRALEKKRLGGKGRPTPVADRDTILKIVEGCKRNFKNVKPKKVCYSQRGCERSSYSRSGCPNRLYQCSNPRSANGFSTSLFDVIKIK